MNPLDREARASRFIDAMDALHDLMVGRSPMMPIEAEPLAQLFGLINDEAKKVVRTHVPGERAPGLSCANDEDDDE